MSVTFAHPNQCHPSHRMTIQHKFELLDEINSKVTAVPTAPKYRNNFMFTFYLPKFRFQSPRVSFFSKLSPSIHRICSRQHYRCFGHLRDSTQFYQMKKLPKNRFQYFSIPLSRLQSSSSNLLLWIRHFGAFWTFVIVNLLHAIQWTLKYKAGGNYSPWFWSIVFASVFALNCRIAENKTVQ